MSLHLLRCQVSSFGSVYLLYLFICLSIYNFIIIYYTLLIYF